MRIEIKHRFQRAAIHEVEQLYLLDEEFNRTTFERMGYERRLLSRELTLGVLTRALCLAPHKPLPPPFGSLTPGGLFQIREHIRYDIGTHRGTWQTIPSVLSRQFHAAGELAMEQLADSVLFRLDGDIAARIPLLSGLAERQAIKTAESQHAALAQAVREQLASSARTSSNLTPQLR